MSDAQHPDAARAARDTATTVARTAEHPAEHPAASPEGVAAEHPGHLPDTSVDPSAEARSVLSCPAGVHLVVDGVDDVLADLDDLGMQDLDGRPTFSCPLDSALAGAARRGRSAILTVHSGLGAPGSADRDAVLTLAGRVTSGGRESCSCCDVVRETVVLELTFALLTRTDDAGAEEQLRVPLDGFVSPHHQLNRGFLQRSADHANHCHQDELRQAVSRTTGTRLAELIGVSLADLRPHRVDIRWVDRTGARSRTLAFPRAARSPRDLGELLRSELHRGLC